MNTLIFTHGEPTFLPPVILSSDETICGPFYNNLKVNGRYRYLHTSLGTIDAQEILARIQPQDQPDVLLVHADSTLVCLPRNLPDNCTKILLIGDTHHTESPIQKMVHYAQCERFDAIFLWNRQHAHYFTELEFSNVYWLPGLLFSVPATPIPSVKTEELCFFGQLDKRYLRRMRILSAIMKAGYKVDGGHLSRRQSLELVARSKAALNISLNGDFNLRVFETTQNGALLYTDELSDYAGLKQFYRDGENVVTYASTEELQTKLNLYSQNLEQATQISAAGKQTTDTYFSFEARRKAFFNLINGKESCEAYHLWDEPRCRIRSASPQNKRATLRRIQVYEFLQDLHKTHEQPNVVLSAGVSPFVATDLADLPRLNQYYAMKQETFEQRHQPLITKMEVGNLARIDPEKLRCLKPEAIVTTQQEVSELLPQIQSPYTKVCILDYLSENKRLHGLMKDHGYHHLTMETKGLFERGSNAPTARATSIKASDPDLKAAETLLSTQ